MSTSKRRRQNRSSEEMTGELSRSSLRPAIYVIASVMTVVAIISFFFVRMPTISTVGRQTWDAQATETSSQGPPTAGMSRSTPASLGNLDPAPVTWIAELPYGTHGSPRLFSDGQHREMILAFGDERNRIGGATAIDVVTGKSRWQITSEDEMFTLPVLMEVRASGEAPVMVAGRNGQLYAVDATSGKELWKFQPSGEEGRSKGIYNFFTGRPLPDVNDDGTSDFLIPNGGDSRRNRYQSRPPGHLLVLSGADGSILHQLQVPDQRETYLSPLFWNRGDETLVVFGTGGETFPGSLWTVPIESILGGTLDGVQVVVPDAASKGAIPPPSFADLDDDGLLDLISAPFDARMIVISGRDGKTLWQFAPSGVQETQCSPTIADFNGDGALDVAYATQEGIFPRWTASYIRVFDGRSGDLMWEHKIEGNLSAASPLALDIDGDQRDELFFIHANPALFRPSSGQKSVSQLQVLHVDEGRIEDIGAVDGFNAGSGWIGDADDDGNLEWYVPLKMDGNTGRLVKVDLKTPSPGFIAWGGYLGTQHDGVYHPRAKESL